MPTVLFSNPPWWSVDTARQRILAGVRSGAPLPFLSPARSTPDHFAYGNYVPFPHLLAEAASDLAQALPSHLIVVRDSIARRENYDTYFRALLQLRPDHIVIESAPRSWPHDARILRQLRRNHPRARLVVCGPFPGNDTSSLVANADLDALIIGHDYEQGLRQALSGENGLLHSAPLDRERLASAPPPLPDEAAALHACDPVPHAESQLSLPVYPHHHFSLSRSATSSHPSRPRPLGALARQLSARFARHAARGVYFDDPGLAADADYVDALCRVMLDLRTNWSLLLRPGLPGDHRWLALRKSGCHGVRFAITGPADLAPFAIDAARVKALGMTAHASFTRPVADKPALVRALSSLHVCNSIQDLAPEPLEIDRIETRTLVVETPNQPALACAS